VVKIQQMANTNRLLLGTEAVAGGLGSHLYLIDAVDASSNPLGQSSTDSTKAVNSIVEFEDSFWVTGQRLQLWTIQPIQSIFSEDETQESLLFLQNVSFGKQILGAQDFVSRASLRVLQIDTAAFVVLHQVMLDANSPAAGLSVIPSIRVYVACSRLACFHGSTLNLTVVNFPFLLESISAVHFSFHAATGDLFLTYSYDNYPFGGMSRVVNITGVKALAVFNQTIIKSDIYYETIYLSSNMRFYFGIASSSASKTSVDVRTKQPCHSSCRTCNGPNSNECLACRKGFYLDPMASCLVCGSGCAECQDLTGDCLLCIAGYIYPDSTCGACSKQGFFISGIYCNPCSSSCLTCDLIATNCTACPTSQYLYSNHICGSCLESGVALSSLQICEPCDILQGQCITRSITIAGQCINCSSGCLQCNCDGLLSLPLKCEVCEDHLFLDLITNQCVACTGIGQMIRGKVCDTEESEVVVPEFIRAPVSSSKAEVEVSILCSFRHGQTLQPITSAGLNKILFKSLLISAKLISKVTGKTESAEARLERYSITDNLFGINFEVETALEEDKYTLEIGTDHSIGPIIYEGHKYKISEALAQLDFISYFENKSTLYSNQKRNAVLGVLTSLAPTPSIYWIEAISFLASFDPTGCFVRFSLFVRTWSRMYFINIDFGKHLGSFLSSLEQYSMTGREGRTMESIEREKGWKGKISDKKVMGQIWGRLSWKISLYSTLWFFRCIASILAIYQVKIGRAGLACLYYLPQLHMICFNYVIFDLAFYCCRIALQTKASSFSVQASLGILLLLTLDMLSLSMLTLDKASWVKAFSRRQTSELLIKNQSPIYSPQPYLQKRSSSALSKDDPTTLLSNRAALQLNMHIDTASTTTSKAIDYAATYENIEFRVPIILYMTTFVPLRRSVFLSISSRTFNLVSLMRVCLMQSVLVSTQHCARLGIVVMLATEIGRISLICFWRCKAKILVSDMLLAGELLEGFAVGSFLVLCLLLVNYQDRQPVSANLQSWGIVSGSVSICSEYFVLMVQGYLLFVSCCRSRKFEKSKAKNEAKKTQVAWYLVFQSAEKQMKVQSNHIQPLSKLHHQQSQGQRVSNRQSSKTNGIKLFSTSTRRKVSQLAHPNTSWSSPTSYPAQQRVDLRSKDKLDQLIHQQTPPTSEPSSQ